MFALARGQSFASCSRWAKNVYMNKVSQAYLSLQIGPLACLLHERLGAIRFAWSTIYIPSPQDFALFD